jgi:hypothetical protein
LSDTERLLDTATKLITIAAGLITIVDRLLKKKPEEKRKPRRQRKPRKRRR